MHKTQKLLNLLLSNQ